MMRSKNQVLPPRKWTTACRQRSWKAGRRVRSRTAVCVAAAGVLLLAAGGMRGDSGSAPGASQPSATTSSASVRPTTRVLACMSGGCHSELHETRFLHGPVAVGACQTCHSYVDAAQHTFEQKRADEALCDFCHIGRAEGKVVHKPVEQGQCLSCHSPHGAENRELLRKPDLVTLCESCHDDVTRNRRHAHGPVATGSCSVCHESHSGDHPKLLVAQGRELCLDCHKQMAREIAKVRHVHEPVKGDCLQCHEAHASNDKMQIKAAPYPLCVSCHDHADIQKQVANAVYKHSPVTDGRACMNCHTAHGSDLADLMRSRPREACLTCHDKPIEAVTGTRTVAGVADLADPDLSRHGPIREGSCSGCHEVHGGKISRLLSAEYPDTFYESFAVEKYDLCFDCHSPQLGLLKETSTVTRFRNGSTNLHYIHVNKPRRGRSCRACHSTHASPNPMHVRKSVPFGRWEMPINFVPSKTGGTCTAGCHRALAYDRDKPVKLADAGKAKE